MQVGKLWIDLETYSETPIKNGTYRYAEDSEIMLFLYAFDDEGPKCWDVTTGSPIPEELEDVLLHSDCEVWSHNSMFDRTVLNYNKLEVALERYRDTMVQALCHALPGALGKLCEVFGISEDDAKQKDGRSLIHLFCKPRPKNTKLRRATSETHPVQWARFIEYGKADIKAMRALHKVMPKFNYPNGQSDELGHWHLDQRINDRGFQVDLELVNAAINAVELEKKNLKQQAFDATNGAVTNATRRDKVLEYILMEYGIPLPDLTKSSLERRLNDPDMPNGVKELLAIRLQATSTSTSKYLALQRAVNDDGRCRGTIQFGGASRTLRAAGRTFQPQNLPSRGLLDAYEIDFGIQALIDGDAGFYFPNVMKLLSSCVRGVLTASPGRELAVADLAAIEGRFTAWLSGEEWALEAYRDFDKGIGSDMYVVTYASAFKLNASQVTKAQRQIGKVLNLFLGYAGGVGAFVTGALGYGFDLEELAEDNWDTLPEGLVREANSFYGYVIKRNMNTFGLSKEAFITCDVLKRLWRESNPNITSMWKRLEESIRQAISNPGEVFEVGEFIKVLRSKNWLRIRLPSGRSLCYANPRLSERGEISYMGLNNYTRQWQRLKGYGGLFLENCLAGDSRVVTNTGVKCLINVTSSDKVWDGVEFVGHSGVLFQGSKELVSVNGIRMTPDHKILTEEGWKIASSCEGLNRHESWLPDGCTIPPGELRLEELQTSSEQPEGECSTRNTEREDDSERSRTTIRSEEIDISLSVRTRLAPVQSIGPVYDLMNCGPRNRFVVLDEDDVPLIVHNCCQAGSRDILYGSMPRAEAAGFAIVLHVHDELVTEFDPNKELTLDNLCEILSAPVQWAPGLPLSAAGFQSTRYRK